MLLKDRLDVPHRIEPALLRQNSGGFTHFYRAGSLFSSQLRDEPSILHGYPLLEEFSINLVQLIGLLPASASLDVKAALEVIKPFLVVFILPLCLLPRDRHLALIDFQLRKNALSEAVVRCRLRALRHIQRGSQGD